MIVHEPTGVGRDFPTGEEKKPNRGRVVIVRERRRLTGAE